jgi:PAS domain S-box-containing protein
MKDIVVLAPIMDIYNKAIHIVEERGYRNVEVILGTMSEGLKLARKLEKEGVKIIVTRGGTYRLVREALNIPVVEIKVSAFDIIESFDKLQDPNEVIGLVGYTNVVYGFDILKKFIPNEVVKIELKKEQDIFTIIEEYKNKGIKTFIGDSNMTRIVEGLNCRGILINSQSESILTAIQEARRINNATREEHSRAQQITTMADFVHDGIIAIDADESITIYNKTAERIFGVPYDKAINKKIREVVPNSMLPYVLKTGEVQVGEIQNVRDIKISTNRAPISVNGEITGAVATFQDITELQNIEQKIRRSLDERGFIAKYNFSDIIHVSDKMKECIEIAKEYSKYDTPIHICGESGVGKELLCQSIHNSSSRCGGPFVAVNCAAIPPTLIESEFFGYEEGSFTGAKRKGKPGVFELAHKGTLFLDEISEIPRELQGRLLRVLQEKQVMRLGGDKIIPVDVKIITASNKYLKKMVVEGEFRKDLYFRINVLSLRIPSLNKRKEDITVLAEHFIRKYSRAYNKKPLEITRTVRDLLINRNYEGNIRELENLIERCVIQSSFNCLKDGIEHSLSKRAMDSPLGGEDLMETAASLNMGLKELEDSYIRMIYSKTGENVTQTCEILKINRTTLWRKLNKI